MAFPDSWPPRVNSSRASIRFYVEGTTNVSGNFSDNAYMFIDDTGANPMTAIPIIRPGDTTTVVTVRTPGGTGITTPNPVTGVAGAKSQIWSNTIRIYNDGGNDIEFTFDGTNVHGRVKAGTDEVYRGRVESGIAVRVNGGGVAVPYRIEAW